MADGHPPVTTLALDAASCSVKEVLERVGDKWSILVIAALARRPWRFRQLQRALPGISQRMLTVTLRRLERDGLVARAVLGTRPPQVEYSLTTLGLSLAEPLRALAQWSETHRSEIAASRREWDAANAR